VSGSAEHAIRSEVVKADFFQRIGYTTVWEDERIIEEGLAPAAGERVLSITSGGDFSLHCLLRGATVDSLDFNPRQTWLLEYKKAAAETLDYRQLWQVLGLEPHPARGELYQRLRDRLSPDAARYWDAHPDEVRTGALLCGRQDRYLHLVARVITLVQGRALIRDLFAAETAERQREIFDARWHAWSWRWFSWVIFNRRILDRAFHKDHFRYAQHDEHPADIFRKQTERVFRDIPLRDNFYLHLAFARRYADHERCPAWLRASRFADLKRHLPRLRLHTGELEQFIFGLPDRSIDCGNFSNIFDWVSDEAFVELMRQTARVARDGARLCYWTNAVNRRKDPALLAAAVPAITEDRELSARLYASCRPTGYSSCTVCRVKK